MTRPKGTATDQANHGGASRRTPTSRRGISEDVNFVGWANFTITDDRREAFNEWALSDELFLDLDAVIGNGLKLSVGIDKDGKSYVATVFDRNPLSQNAGMMSSQRSGTAWRALAKLVYAITHGMGEDWARWSSENRTEW